ncbi:MAG TPA: DUF1801 domain-containing protein [Terriglobales bacterium]|nr:DUF1801 domain-containing protein [Terriglobales bacterium]
MNKKSVVRRSLPKNKIPNDIDDYLADVPEPARSTLEKVRAAIRAAAPKEATECISYRIPTFDYQGHLVAFAAFKNHCSLFPMSYAVIRACKDELKRYTQSGKGTIQFPVDKPLSPALIRKIVKARVAEQEKKAR